MTARNEPWDSGASRSPAKAVRQRPDAGGEVSQPSRVIILNCFGRGGSSILWNMLGSSPDVIMTGAEWHQAVFGGARRTRRLITKAFCTFGLSSLPVLRRHAHRALLAACHEDDLRSKPPDAAVVTKVMDYHIAFNAMIAGEFDETRNVVLTRHPFGQCESLMRSGLRIDQACRWYCDVATRMAGVIEESGAVQVRFERLMKAPVDTCGEVYAAVGVSWRADRRFRHKVKRFGADRRGNGDFAENRYEWIGSADAASYIDGNVVESAVARLSADTRARIWRETRGAAIALGYSEDSPGGVA